MAQLICHLKQQGTSPEAENKKIYSCGSSVFCTMKYLWWQKSKKYHCCFAHFLALLLTPIRNLFSRNISNKRLLRRTRLHCSVARLGLSADWAADPGFIYMILALHRNRKQICIEFKNRQQNFFNITLVLNVINVNYFFLLNLYCFQSKLPCWRGSVHNEGFGPFHLRFFPFFRNVAICC